MPLIGNDFVIEPAPYTFRCDECERKISRGQSCQVSRRFGKVQKRLCERESCRQSFDDRYWQERARERVVAPEGK
jgi:hypothetical protein